ncbi:DUF1028 domain-containing protein [uncultured Corynebacterium sp.]|uniref:DUF1028 domain-containing protein n=1 Tax=uncultured Corynebacterium sp. TaxID=159447 RepID=UPI0025D1D11F|nr:DUF1028 domain-containing protein [uncultured Corynebacterium sp.]
MTFSIVARDTAADGTVAFGMAVSSSSPAVAARCLHVRSRVGVAASQNITDPRFGPFLLDALASGATAAEALETLARADATLDYRQLSVLGAAGPGATWSGPHTLGTYASAVGEDAVCAGNMLASAGVPDAMLAAFESSATSGVDLENRLLAAMQAGLTAGGEAGPVHSAGLAVVRSAGWIETDLRVDWSEAPVEDLADLLEVWLPQRDDYVTRGIDPASSPSYGVPGDE